MSELKCPYCGHENDVPSNYHNQKPLEHQDCNCAKCKLLFDFVYNEVFAAYRMDDEGNVVDENWKIMILG
ncbi:MAG: hypothetical protein PHS34_08640 [Candidatus Omnitrophica bacterium]|nr:hypothetical protein [Candidatus Omnitrophota bacterium]